MVVASYYQVLLAGAFWTVVLCVLSGLLSLVGGIPLALASISKIKTIQRTTAFFIWLFLGTPLLLQLFLIYFGLPQMGIYFPPILSGIIGLSLHYAVYNSSVIRAGVVAIELGQYEASRSLGLSHLETMFKVILPQALRNVTPALGNNLISLLKESALVSIITVPELTLAAQRAISETFRPFEFYFAAGVLYYIINYYILEKLLYMIERRIELSR
ncbi:MAG: amino acid ABC transporter permease [Thermodesulfobacteriota bacterium]